MSKKFLINKITSVASICFCLTALAIAMFTGCNNERTPNTLANTHPTDWMVPIADDFHGKVVVANGSGLCAECHGDDLDGGISETSCIDCHLSSGACTACHGGDDNKSGAPPRGLESETDVTTRAVGAHTTHLEGGDLSNAFECQSCHLIPVTAADSAHLDIDGDGNFAPDSVAEITWQGIAGDNAQWDSVSERCQSVYCHGNFTGGYNTNAPLWTGTDQAVCETCHAVHGNPADLGWKHDFHMTDVGLTCNDCHAAVVDNQLTIIGLDLHVNGLADTLTADSAVCVTCHGAGSGTCTNCHGGSDNQTGAPPVGIEGETEVDELAVGAHTIHLEGGTYADPFPCKTCHVVPQTWDAPGHQGPDFIAEITWDSLAGTNASWDRVAARCTDTYCHGDFRGGNAGNLPVWTDSTQVACGSCHDDGSSPANLRDRHQDHADEGIDCYQCHAGTVDDQLNIIGRRIHVDGVNDVIFSSGQGIWSGGSCTNTGCHESPDSEDW